MVHWVFKGEVDPFFLTKSEICAEAGGGSKHVLPRDVCGQWKIYGISVAGAGASSENAYLPSSWDINFFSQM